MKSKTGQVIRGLVRDQRLERLFEKKFSVKKTYVLTVPALNQGQAYAAERKKPAEDRGLHSDSFNLAFENENENDLEQEILGI
jgi:hypothetical protein